MDKQRVLVELRAAVATALEAMARITADTRDEATGSESRAENQYDTRATEAAYLAAGQGERLLALKDLVEWLEQLDPRATFRAVGPGALVELDRDGVSSWILVGPQGGQRVTLDGRPVLLVSADSPLGTALKGLEPGDATETETPSGPQVLEVCSVR